MLDLPFLLDKCEECGAKWRPADRNAYKRCLVCDSRNVTLARPAVLIGAGAVVLVLAAVVFAAGRPHKHDQEPGGVASKQDAAPAYVAPISTALPGSQPAASADASAAAASPPKANADASNAAPVSTSTSTPGAKGNGDVSAAAAGAGPTAEQFPTLDCAVSRSEAAHKVCASAALSKMDQELLLLYMVAAQNGKDKRSMAAEQTQWEHGVLEACSDENCIAYAYKQRADQLSGELGGQNQQ